MRFEPAFLDLIRTRLPCSEVCGRRVQLKKAGREWRGLSPFNAEKTPSFYVNDMKRAWFDFSSGRNGNVFDFVMAVEGISFRQAVEQCAADAGVPMPRGYREGAGPTPEDIAAREVRQRELDARNAERQRADESQETRLRKIAYRIWHEGQPLADTQADRYLLARGIDFARQFPSLRFHPRLEHRDPETGVKSFWPALIAAVQHPKTDRFLAVWRIYLDKDDKAPVPSPKMGLGTFAPYGGAVRLGRPTSRANPCEGIETGLGVFGLLRGAHGVQATTSTAGLVNFVPPTGCSSTLIWPDGDTNKLNKTTGKWSPSPGLNAARILNEADRERGHPSTIQPIPMRSVDWNDVWVKAKGKMDDER